MDNIGKLSTPIQTATSSNLTCIDNSDHYKRIIVNDTSSIVNDTREDYLGLAIVSDLLDWSTSGAVLALRSKNATSSEKGTFILKAGDGTNNKYLYGFPYKEDDAATLFWDGKPLTYIVSQANNYIRYSDGIQHCFGYISSSNSVITFGASFLYAPMILFSSYDSSSSKIYYTVKACNVSTTGFIPKSCILTNSNGDSFVSADYENLGCIYFAYGYWRY